MTRTVRETPAGAVTAMVDHVLAPAAARPRRGGVPAWADGPVHTPHTAVRRVAGLLIDHLAELEARPAGAQPQPHHGHARAAPTEADLAPFTPEDLDEAHSRLSRLAGVRADRLDALSDDRSDHSPGEGRSFGEPARHLAGPTYCADAVGELS